MKQLSKFATLATVTLLAVTLASCAGEPSAEPAPEPTDVTGDVTYWHYTIGDSGEDSYWAPVIERFNEQYPNVDVEVVVQPFSGREEALTVSLAGKQAPDVVYFNPDFIPRFAEEGVLEPVTDIVEGDDDWRESAIDAMAYDGEVYGVPILMNAGMTVCFADVLEAAGIECPETWDDVSENAPALKEAGYFSTQYEGAVQVTLNGTFYTALAQAGGSVFSDDGSKAAFNSAEGLETLEFLKLMAENEYFPSAELSTLTSFEQTPAGNSKVGFMATSTPRSLDGFYGRENMVAGPPLTNKETVGFGTVGGLSIFNTTDSLDASKAWIDFLTSPEELKPFLEATGYQSPRPSITGLFEEGSLEDFQTAYLDDAYVGEMHPQAREVISLLAPHVQDAILGRTDPQAALDAAEAEINALLSRG